MTITDNTETLRNALVKIEQLQHFLSATTDALKATTAERDALIAERKSHCACRFDGDKNTEQCKLHAAWNDTLYEQADYRRERDDLRAALAKAELHIKHIGNDALRSENAQLRAELAAIRALPAGTVIQKPSAPEGNWFVLWTQRIKPGDVLYLAPGAQGEKQ